MNVFEPHLEKSTFQAMVFLKLTTSICLFQPITVNFELIPSPTWWAATVDLVGGGAVCYNIFNVVIWYRQSFISLLFSFLSCNCYLICIILYVRRRKFDQLQFFLSVPTSVSYSDNLSIWSQDEAHLYFLTKLFIHILFSYLVSSNQSWVGLSWTSIWTSSTPRSRRRGWSPVSLWEDVW